MDDYSVRSYIADASSTTTCSLEPIQPKDLFVYGASLDRGMLWRC